MKEQILPTLPIVGRLKLSSRDGKSLCDITVTTEKSSRQLEPFFEQCYQELKAYLEGHKKVIDLPLDLSGLTPFQARVLKEMKKIPYGEVQSYKDLAARMKSKGFQAIGSACGRNPFMLIYPCHRVVGSKGLGGFAHGPRMKMGLLKLEGALVSP